MLYGLADKKHREAAVEIELDTAELEDMPLIQDSK